MIFIDADAFIGLYRANDVHHLRARKIFSQLEKSQEGLITSWDVVDEVTTKLSYQTTKKIALTFLKGVFNSDIQIVFPDRKLALMAQKIFQSQKSKKVSLTDCLNMTVAREKKIKKFFSFDRVYEKNGFKLLRAN
jgi:predicted nucleic acid-binding protein